MKRDLSEVVFNLKNPFYAFEKNMEIIMELKKRGCLPEVLTEDDDPNMIETLMYCDGNKGLREILNKLVDMMSNAGLDIKHLRKAMPYVLEDEVVEYIYIDKNLHINVLVNWGDDYKRLCELAYQCLNQMCF